MIRRLFWVGTGVFLGLWGRRKVIDTVDRYVPQRVQTMAQVAARAAWRDAMKASKRAKRIIDTTEVRPNRSTQSTQSAQNE